MNENTTKTDDKTTSYLPSDETGVTQTTVLPRGRRIFATVAGTLTLLTATAILLFVRESRAACNAPDKKTQYEVKLEQTDDNAPLSPKYRMYSNCRCPGNKHTNAIFKVVVTPPVDSEGTVLTVTATVSGSAGVKATQVGLSEAPWNTKTGLQNGNEIELHAPWDGSGNWTLQIDAEKKIGDDPKCHDKVSDYVIRLDELRIWDEAKPGVRKVDNTLDNATPTDKTLYLCDSNGKATNWVEITWLPAAVAKVEVERLIRFRIDEDGGGATAAWAPNDANIVSNPQKSIWTKPGADPVPRKFVVHAGLDCNDDTVLGSAEFTRELSNVVIRVDIGMDGDRDDAIHFDDPDDAKYLFWVNDDVDVISGSEEDDAQSGTANCNDSAITCKRDLEDFTRLHIKVDDNTANLSGITYFLKFENVSSGSPSVNIFEAVGESSAYLSDTSVAAQQIQKTKLITVGTTEVQLPNQYVKTGDQVSPFIVEGKTAGKGDLTIIVKKDGNEVCKKAVNLDLRPITAFYEKYVVTVSTGDDVNTTDGGNANSTTYTPETDEYVLHVHGWNMADWEKDRWTETVFKRLWWQRYKGHVGGLQWPTYTGSLTYDASEIRAWRSGQALNNRIATLNATYSGQVRVLAHSMGNVVMGEALRLFSSSVVHTYIAAQAAIPAHCYDNTIGNYWTGFNTPNIYARYSSGLSPDTPYLAANSSHAGAMALYFNAQDYALGWWENNNEMKPDLNYWNTDGDSNVDSYAPGSGDRFYYDSLLPFDERTMVIPDDRFEIFARIVESRSRALGQESAASGFGTARNLQTWGYNDQHYSHSREFRSNVADEWPFWNAFFGDAGLTR